MLYIIIIVLAMLVFSFVYATILVKVAKFLNKDRTPYVLEDECRNRTEKKVIIIIALITFISEVIFTIPIWPIWLVLFL